jgi:hypothetical protein
LGIDNGLGLTPDQRISLMQRQLARISRLALGMASLFAPLLFAILYQVFINSERISSIEGTIRTHIDREQRDDSKDSKNFFRGRGGP